ncbi:MAG: DUF3592 domain-containing protein [Candidatus Hydrogenedentes bacterium]|nr:DUF3592 domain-containing protein [Candidatus Hydrogenedentota bacterium]
MLWKRKGPTDTAPISSRAAKGGSAGCMIAFFSVFLLMGAGFFFFAFLPAGINVIRARTWDAVPCTIVSSDVESHSGEDTTYSIAIAYTYTVNGREYRSDRYQFMGGSSSGYRGKRAVVDRHPPGSKAICYVNPADPAEAVLNRGITPDFAFALIPIVFMAVGAGGIVYGLRRKPAPPRAASWLPESLIERYGTHGAPANRASEFDTRGRIKLKPATSPAAKFGGLLFLALFWNGIVAVPVWKVIEGFQSGAPEWILTVFMVPFAAAGALLIVVAGSALLALFNPRPALTLNTATPALGDILDVEWAMQGAARSIDEFTIHLEGVEKATYTRGTDTQTDTNPFAAYPVAESTSYTGIMTGHAQVTIPAGTMHSFKSQHNEILWSLHVRGVIARWPDIDEEFPILILPRPGQGGSQ